MRELSDRLEWVELAGEPEYIRSNFAVGSFSVESTAGRVVRAVRGVGA